MGGFADYGLGNVRGLASGTGGLSARWGSILEIKRRL